MSGIGIVDCFEVKVVEVVEVEVRLFNLRQPSLLSKNRFT